ncbi:hypothetical protein ACFL6N_03655 [Thermodesulfobacteriota bacterium]
MLKKYLQYSSAGIVLLFVLDVLLFGHAFDRISWALLLAGGLCFVLARYYHQTVPGIRLAGGLLLVPITALLHLLLLVLVVLMVANSPPGKSFKPRVELVEPAGEARDAYQQWITQLDNAQGPCYQLPDDFLWDINKFDFTYPGFDELFTDACLAERAHLLTFAATRQTAMPFVEIAGELALPMEMELPAFTPLMNAFKIETAHVVKLLATGQAEAAGEKYLFLWQAAFQRLTAQEGLLNTMVSLATINFLADLYGDREGALPGVKGAALASLLARIPAAIDASLAHAFATEYGFQKGFILQIATGRFGLEGEDRFLAWPLFDPYAQLQYIEEIFVDVIAIQRLKFPENSNALAELNGKMSAFAAHPYSLVNPVGRILTAIATPNYDSYIERKEIIKSRIIAMHYLLSFQLNDDPGSVPVDNLTGREFAVIREADYFEITGQEVSFRVFVKE